MKNVVNQRLCGGTFFTLLLQARKPRMGVREHYMSTTDGLSEPETLIALAKVVVPDMLDPQESMMKTIKSNVFNFKTCKNTGGTYFPFGDVDARTTFDIRVKTDYRKALTAMLAFIDGFIDTGGSTKKDERLVRALVELISIDDSILNEQLFYIREDGKAVTKSELIIASEFCLQPFLLGIWHFVLLYRKDNTVGRETYDDWCPPRGGAERLYTSTLGERITKPMCVYVYKAPAPCIEVETTDEEQMGEFDGPILENNSSPNIKETTQQTINLPFIFNQSGNNNVQIGNVDTLTINNS